ncbi:HDOD domain-containing protein [Ideonella sp. 4Y11]|uniref:HDOD domain-containing protein n=1 Tax=Ideonella aquatica TaxID=2824119 RepID=A0A940YH25_9BURK|nr:HDOD domain-containing protein [Ideonella aquatica]MBQ0959274.1 HDOD domain-containing protein [Ideonella aquatica]
MDAPVSPAPRRLPRDLPGWLRYLQLAEIPVMQRTADALETLRAIEDDVDGRMLVEVIGADPLMSLKVLAHIAGHHRSRRLTDVETVGQALVLLGITPFFSTFGPQPTIEQHLADQPEALAGLHAVIARAHRASRFAIGFAVHRMDHDAQVIEEAALLHDFAEMLLWLHAPSLALEMRRRQRADPTLRSSAIQRELMGTTLVELQQALMRAWRLPDLLVHITDDRHEEASQVRNVMLAIRLARHTAAGWDNAAIPDDVRDIAQLLNMGVEPTAALLHDIDQD